jgi:uncharacterized repeat protein (TIGR01451 family)
VNSGSPGSGGAFGGNAVKTAGGGGAALGGAIFNDSGSVIIQNSTFTRNSVAPGPGSASNGGADGGGAIFSRNGSLTVMNATISGNRSNVNGGGITVINDGAGASLKLDNTILANNGGDFECKTVNSVGTKGAGNLILAMSNSGCPNVAVTSDPQLGVLQVNSPGDTPTMAIQSGSSAADAGDDAALANDNITTDQRGVPRPQGPHSDIGAFEAPPPSADLSLTKAVSSSTALVGDTLTYTLTVANAGPNVGNSVVVTDNLPSAVTFVSCGATGGGVCGGAGNNVTISYTSLAVNASSTITIQATLNSGVADGLAVVNSASVSGASPIDPDTSNNSASASFTVQNKSDLFVTKKANLTSVKASSNLVYTVTVKNLGPYRATAVVLNDPVPANTTFVSLNAGGASCSAPALGTVGTITCNFGNMANGASATVTLTVKVNGSGNKTSITNTASASSPSFDPNTANNSASVTTQIYGNRK